MLFIFFSNFKIQRFWTLIKRNCWFFFRLYSLSNFILIPPHIYSRLTWEYIFWIRCFCWIWKIWFGGGHSFLFWFFWTNFFNLTFFYLNLNLIAAAATATAAAATSAATSAAVGIGGEWFFYNSAVVRGDLVLHYTVSAAAAAAPNAQFDSGPAAAQHDNTGVQSAAATTTNCQRLVWIQYFTRCKYSNYESTSRIVVYICFVGVSADGQRRSQSEQSESKLIMRVCIQGN